MRFQSYVDHFQIHGEGAAAEVLSCSREEWQVDEEDLRSSLRHPQSLENHLHTIQGNMEQGSGNAQFHYWK